MPESSLQILNWDAPNGILLKKFIAQLPQDRPIVLNVFGSTPLHMRLDPSFLSGDVDMLTSEDLTGHLDKMKLGKEHTTPYIELIPATIFITNAGWRDRAAKEVFGSVTVYIAAALDVLVGKLKRLDPKNLAAFDLVKAKTGGPTEDELRHALRMVVDMYRPAFLPPPSRSKAPEGLLDSYQTERHPLGVQVLDWSRAQVEIMKPSPQSRALNAIFCDLMTRAMVPPILRDGCGVHGHREKESSRTASPRVCCTHTWC